MKEDIKEILSTFFAQTETDSLDRKHYPPFYSGLVLQAGFGRGRVAKIPWIAFLGKDQKVTDGIFPVFYFFKENQKLILAYALSETETPKLKWLLSPRMETVRSYFKNFGIEPYKYGSSYVYEVYDTGKELDWNKVEDDLNQLIKYYKKVLA